MLTTSNRISKEVGKNWGLVRLAMSTRVSDREDTSIAAVLSFRTGTYLGIDVAIKEVLPSNDYDVAKYFEREWRLMKYVVSHIHCGSLTDSY